MITTVKRWYYSAIGKEFAEHPDGGYVRYEDYVALERLCDAAIIACRAAVKYDEGVLGQAARGEVDLLDKGGGVASGDHLDNLYFDWRNKSRAALVLAGEIVV